MPIYVVTADVGLRVRLEPVIPFAGDVNNRIDVLPYGQEVERAGKKGGWFFITYTSNGKIKQGWVMAEYLESKSSFLKNQKPIFKIGIPNLYTDSNTKIVRRVIGDEFGGGKNKWDLQCTEYVQYKLQTGGIKINWPVRGGRDGGLWGRIFERYNLYRVSDVPTVGSAMCFTSGFRTPPAQKTGHVAFVEKVFSDGFVFISEVNVPNFGKYNERKLSPVLWKEKFKAQFVDFQ